MAKKTYAVLNPVMHGVGPKHRLLKEGDLVEFDPEDPDQRETVAELLAKDYIEDPEHPKERTPEQKMALETRQIAARALHGPSSAAIRREQADMHRVERLETILAEGGKLTPEEEAEARAIARSKADDDATLMASRLAAERGDEEGATPRKGR